MPLSSLKIAYLRVLGYFKSVSMSFMWESQGQKFSKKKNEPLGWISSFLAQAYSQKILAGKPTKATLLSCQMNSSSVTFMAILNLSCWSTSAGAFQVLLYLLILAERWLERLYFAFLANCCTPLSMASISKMKDL
eukprot:CAMPEP_0170559340 /NCGR_PEP_ID=MMETSP0211-20121228/42036_1 /TAXON_ID=311385 /ORGANISM="Pseudokeronopsis sp., Strain OXSARD2" /LENGTH=134 /DNA_ID=CAMNT_0010872265 /DNA_START=185 /DNA_END=589 /DNA_ORIENTATION=+